MAALASLTANYTDSEEEEDAKEDAGEAKDSTAPSSNADEASNLSAKSASRDEFINQSVEFVSIGLIHVSLLRRLCIRPLFHAI